MCYGRLIQAEANSFPGRGLKRGTGVHSPPTSPSPKRRKKKKEDDDASEDEDEVAQFRARPAGAVNKPMQLQPIDKVRKNVIDLSLAAVDPNASFAERVAHFDNLEAIAKKRKLTLLSILVSHCLIYPVSLQP